MKLMRMVKGAMMLLVLQLGFMQWAEAKVYTVTDKGDSGDNTLRWAIKKVNESADSSNSIQFSFEDSNGNPLLTTIKLTSDLPAITKAGTTINGYANGMGEKNSLSVGNNTQLRVVLQGSNTFNGLIIKAADCEIKGLVVGGFDQAIKVLPGISGITITGNFIGVDNTGKGPFANTTGIYLEECSSVHVSGNVISGNNQYGLDADKIDNCVFEGNMVGVNALGDAALPNGFDGLSVNESSNIKITSSVISGNFKNGVYLNQVHISLIIDKNIIGTDATGQFELANKNNGLYLQGCTDATITSCLLSGNKHAGLLLSDSEAIVQDCFVGTDSTGTKALPNIDGGIYLNDSPSSIIGGGSDYTHRNIISGNNDYGVFLYGPLTVDNIVTYNYIGLDVNGGLLPNSHGSIGHGGGTDEKENITSPNSLAESIYVVTSSADSGAGTLRQAMLDANAGNGGVITFSFKDGDGNPIPTTISLLSSLPEITQPVVIDGYANGMGVENSLDIGNNAQLNVTIKGYSTRDSVRGKGFVIGCSECTIKGLVLGNCYYAIELKSGISDIAIAGNFIGVDRSGATPLGNWGGIYGSECSYVTVDGNVIAGSSYDVEMIHAHYCVFSNNMVGVNALGNQAIESWGYSGISITYSSNIEISNSVVSGYSCGLDFNAIHGLVISKSLVGTDAKGLYAIKNDAHGAAILNCIDVKIVSCVFSGNASGGLFVSSNNPNTIIQDCFIGTDSTGAYALPNDNGIYMNYSGRAIIGGGDNYEHRNVISGNTDYGVCFFGFSAVGNEVTYNYLGISADGTASLPNGKGNFYAENYDSMNNNTTSPNKTTPS